MNSKRKKLKKQALKAVAEEQLFNLKDKEFVERLSSFKPGQELPRELFNHIPAELVNYFEICKSQRHRDMMLLGILPVLGALMDNVWFQYNEKTYYPSLYVFIIAPPANGKRFVAHAAGFVDRIDKEALQAYLKLKKASQKGDYVKPPFINKIPGDSSGAALKEVLANSNGKGFILETEADTISQALGQDWGGFSDVFRQSFEHESISRLRVGDNVPLVIKKPKFSIVISGTPNQIGGIVKSVGDGTFSRFLYYRIYESPGYQKWGEMDRALRDEEIRRNMSNFGYDLSKLLQDREINMVYEERHRELVNAFAEKWEEKYGVVNDLFKPSIYRGNVQALKICSILSILRNRNIIAKKDKKFEIMTSIEDLKVALIIVSVGLANAWKMLDYIGKKELKPQKADFLENLPNKVEFSTADAMKIGLGLGIKTRAISYRLQELLRLRHLKSPKKGVFVKVE